MKRQLSKKEYLKLKKFFTQCFEQPASQWPERDKWPVFEGLPEIKYYLKKDHQDNDEPYLQIRFSRQVQLPDGRYGTIFKIFTGKEDLTKVYPNF
jgi:hypothetical protein